MGTADAKPTGHMYSHAFVVTVSVGCRLRAPGPEKFIREGSSRSRKVVAINTKFGTRMEFNERNSIAYVIS